MTSHWHCGRYYLFCYCNIRFTFIPMPFAFAQNCTFHRNNRTRWKNDIWFDSIQRYITTKNASTIFYQSKDLFVQFARFRYQLSNTIEKRKGCTPSYGIMKICKQNTMKWNSLDILIPATCCYYRCQQQRSYFDYLISLYIIPLEKANKDRSESTLIFLIKLLQSYAVQSEVRVAWQTAAMC